MATPSHKPPDLDEVKFMAQGVHHAEDERIATEAVDPATLLAENQGLRDRLMRALKDAENARRRAERLLDELRQYSIATFLREMLSVVDNLRHAIDRAERYPFKSVDHAALLEAVRSTERMLTQSLERFGVCKMRALGVPFDPALHEAVIEIEDPKCGRTVGR
jgi:molecular chaperone GrpE